MTRRATIALVLLLAGYLSTGLYVVPGNEMAVVRRFGKARFPLQGSGLHYDLPWPLGVVDRVNLNEVRTLSIGSAETDSLDGGEFLQAVGSVRESQFLTGDKNILNLKIIVSYRVSEEQLAEFLYAAESQERRLQLLTESVAADLISRCGVDFVHTLGLAELNERLTREVGRLAEQHGLGLVVEQVAIDSAYPPIRVKSQFLDVSNARADMVKYINDARAYSEQRLAEGRAEAQRTIDEAERDRRRSIESANGAADRFVKLVEQFRRDEREGIQSYAASRQMALRRAYVATMQGVLRNVAGKVFLDSGRPVDLTIFRDPRE